jgi:hypothetical protein
MSFASVTHLAEGLCLNPLRMLQVENSFIYLAGTSYQHYRIAVYFTLKILIRNTASRYLE